MYVKNCEFRRYSRGTDAADLAQICEGVSLCLRVAVGHDQRLHEDRRIILRRATGIADFNDPVDGTNTVGLDSTNHGIIVLLHEIAFGDVIRATFGAEDQESVEPSSVIHLP